MATNRPGKTQLRKLLDQLEHTADADASRVIIQGRAIGKGTDSLHVAMPDGVVEIPLAEIEDVTVIEDATRQPVVTVVVRSGDAIRQLVTVHTALRPNPLWDPPIFHWPRPIPTPGPDPIGGSDGGYSRTLVCDDSNSGGKKDDSSCVWMYDK